MKSKITGGETKFLFKTLVLNKYTVEYYVCNDTGFIQTEDPYWLDEAYSSAITALDIGLAMRNFKNAESIARLIDDHFNFKGPFLDIAGGYGLFTRLMHDKGFNYFHTDTYCQNIFANHFTLDKFDTPYKFEVATLFEAFEHFNNPVEEISDLLKYSDNIIFSTEIVPDIQITKPDDWWYFVPETGQHIAFYTIKALEHIAKINGVKLYSDGRCMHLFTKKEFSINPFHQPFINDSFIVRQIKKTLAYFEKSSVLKEEKNRPIHPSLLQNDFDYLKAMIDAIHK